ncbi:MAG: SDR family NAD(P)-dependent oxidoreductase [Candidatus Saccharimonadales bacterium]
MLLQGKTALVTGASEGIGRALVEALVAKGVRCIAVSRTISPDVFPSDLVMTHQCDISDKTQVKELLRFVQEQGRGVDVLINNAGIWHKAGQLEDITDDMIESVIATNLLGQIYVTKCFLPLLRQADEAKIVQIIIQ